MKKIVMSLMAVLMAFTMAAQTASAPQNMDKEPIIDIKTTAGDVKIKLFNDTPKHRDNFLKLVNEGFYDGVLFHRVIKDFMIQTGDPDSRNAKPGEMLGSGSPDYLIDAEILFPKHFHKRGAVAAARTDNPEKRSSASQFYIVTGRTLPAAQAQQQLMQTALQSRFEQLVKENMDTIKALQKAGDHAGLQKLQQALIEQTESEVKEVPAEVVEAYTTVGGAPWLDGGYTVFGEVIEGMDVVEQIEKVATDANDRPLDDVRVISMKVE